MKAAGSDIQALIAAEAQRLRQRIREIDLASEQLAREKRLCEARVHGLEGYLFAADRLNSPGLPDFVTARVLRVGSR